MVDYAWVGPYKLIGLRRTAREFPLKMDAPDEIRIAPGSMAWRACVFRYAQRASCGTQKMFCARYSSESSSVHWPASIAQDQQIPDT